MLACPGGRHACQRDLFRSDAEGLSEWDGREIGSAGNPRGDGRTRERLARHYERETTTMTKYLTTVREPVLVVLVAAIVLVVALSVFLPMWDMVTLLG